MIVMAARTALKALRESMQPKATQEDMARSADITLATYRNAEQGKNVSYSTATAILKVMNAELEKRGRPPVALDDLDLHIV